MKKLPTLAMTLTLSTFMVACGENQEEVDSDPETEESVEEATDQQQENEENVKSIEVDKDSSTVKVTIPSKLINEQEKGAEIEKAKEAGASDVEENEDGSLTYTMSEEVHQEMMDDLADEIHENMKEIEEDGGYSSIEEVTVNDSFTEFTLIVNQEKYEKNFDKFAAFGLGTSALYYQLFDGVNSAEYNVEISVEDAESGEAFDTIEFPKILEQADVE